MKAAVVEKPNVLKVMEIPEPEMGEYDALCEILYGAICTGTDLHLIDGSLPFAAFPAVLGHESTGRVIAVGPKVRYLEKGDLISRVGAEPVGDYAIRWGGFAEKGIARDYRAMEEDGRPAEEWRAWLRVRPLPADIDPAAATMVITWRETLSYLTRMGVSGRKRLVVFGSGGNGLSFVAHAANLGATQVAVVGAASREEIARKVGATDYVDYRAGDVSEELLGIGGEGYDFAIDAIGRHGVGDVALSVLAPGGTLGIYGMDEVGQCTILPRRAKGSFTFYNGGYDEAETHDWVIELMEAGRLDASSWLDLRNPYPLEEIDAAFEALRRREAVKALVKIIA